MVPDNFDEGRKLEYRKTDSRKEEAEMTHRDNVKEMLMWTHDKSWYGKDSVRGYFLKKAAPPGARESLRSGQHIKILLAKMTL